MSGLDTTLRLEQADQVYSELIAAHRGLSRDQSERLNARLILLLMIQVGDAEAIRAAIELARRLDEEHRTGA